ncbi:hypothetical protein NWFMUON74_42940 [Nocardia wallacei]|uniref:Uncharacterized protein n=2 Tax=Nocardia wallacei TaxID=480035 RepID=A0A7G1KMT8_9NOCA|nr:hypothetical protein NWFMUON74_42940 [Nocardia wallacei]
MTGRGVLRGGGTDEKPENYRPAVYGRAKAADIVQSKPTGAQVRHAVHTAALHTDPYPTDTREEYVGSWT